MNENNNNFEELKHLLRLKQHEVPPPGYFNDFSSNVVARIRAGEAGNSNTWAEWFADQPAWFSNVLRLFEAKPGMIGGFAVSLCLLLVIGVVVADRPESVYTIQDSGALASTQATPDAPNAPTLAAVVPAVAPADNSGISVSANPLVSLQPVAAGFSQQQNPLFQSASFMTPGR